VFTPTTAKFVELLRQVQEITDAQAQEATQAEPDGEALG